MTSSPSCSSTTTSPVAAAASDLLQEADALSDDSGVDVKPQGRHQCGVAEPNSRRRNKRKSSEPKKRRDVLLMKRFRWDDTDEEEEEDVVARDEEDEEEDNDDVFDEDRPDSGYCQDASSCVAETQPPCGVVRTDSGDSGCFRDATSLVVADEKTQIPCGTVRTDGGCFRDASSAQTQALTEARTKRRPRQWRKPPVKEAIKEEREDEDDNNNNNNSPAFRQSVIRKNETTPCASTAGGETPSNNDVKLKGTHQQPLLSDLARDCGALERRPPRNYKSMSRQRRIEANARERTRVHTISAAFESLRRAVPAYAHNQKLSKLAILRIASAYIVALACLNGGGGPESAPPVVSMADCVEQCTRTIQAEGRSRRRTSNKE